MGRFVNADAVDVILATPTGLTDKNLYSYCDNNPVAREDADGEFWGFVAKFAIGVVSRYVSDVVSESIVCVENVITGKDVNINDSIKNTAMGTVLDIVSDKATNAVVGKKSASENYSSFAHSQYQKNGSMPQTDIYARYYKRNRNIRWIGSGLEFTIGAIRGSLAY